MDSKTDTRLFLLVTAGRLLIFVLLVMAGAIFPGSFVGEVRLSYLSCLLGCAFFLTLIWIYWFQKKGLSDQLKGAQTVTDVLLATMAVYLTGGILSRFSFLYSIAIITSCLLGPKRAGTRSALLSTLFYAIVCIVTRNQAPSLEEAAFTFFLNMAAFNTIALLALSLSKRLRNVEEKLKDTTKDMHLLEEIQRHLANSLRSGLITVDVNGRILYYNIAAHEILGQVVTNSYGKYVTDLIPGSERLLSSCHGQSATGDRRELELMVNDKKMILGISCFKIFDHMGELLGHGLIFQDITEIKAQEERLKLIDRLAALGEMAAGLAHEIRNPLASISGAAEYLGQSGLVMPEGQRLLSIIEREAERLSQLTNSFLLYGRPERKRSETVNLKDEFSAALILLKQRKRLSQAVVEMDVPDDLEITVDGDMLRQVILNVLLNAFQALPEEKGLVRIVATSTDDEVQIEIEDNGLGISPETLKKIFNPFFTTKPEGTGLGLSIVHRIVTELGGNIQVNSEPYTGTRFTITLPLRKEKETPPEKEILAYEAASSLSARNLSMS